MWIHYMAIKSFDSLFSNSYKFTSNSNRVYFKLPDTKSKVQSDLGSGIQLLNFNSHNTTKDITVAHDYINFTPTSYFSIFLFQNTTSSVFLSGQNRNSVSLAIAATYNNI